MEEKRSSISEWARSFLRSSQRNEITEYYVYQNIAKRMKPGKNRETLQRIAQEELAHYHVWKDYTGEEAKPNRRKILWHTLLSRIFGYTFSLKLMERGENGASSNYEKLAQELPQARQIAEDEERHEEELLGILSEERLDYVGAMVLGLNDALVELTGTLAGLTFALQDTKLVALSGLITGISATLSMASSEYLSARSEGRKNPLRSCLYTGIMYLIAVTLLVLPYMLFPPEMFVWALVTMIGVVVLIILVFTYYISVAKDLPFRKRFLEMAGISLSVAAISFVIGLVVKYFLGIDI